MSIFLIVTLWVASSAHRLNATDEPLLLEIGNSISKLPDIILGWKVKYQGGEEHEVWFLHQKGKFYHKIFQVNPSNHMGELTAIHSYDGNIFYGVVGKQSSMTKELIRDDWGRSFQSDFLDNPIFYPLQLICMKRPTLFTLPRIAQADILDNFCLPYFKGSEREGNLVSLKFENDHLTRTLKVDQRRRGITSAMAFLTNAAASKAQYEMDEWLEIEINGSLPFRIPCLIKVTLLEGERIEDESHTITVRKDSVKLLTEKVPDEAFRPTSIHPRTILDLNRSQAK